MTIELRSDSDGQDNAATKAPKHSNEVKPDVDFRQWRDEQGGIQERLNKCLDSLATQQPRTPEEISAIVDTLNEVYGQDGFRHFYSEIIEVVHKDDEADVHDVTQRASMAMSRGDTLANVLRTFLMHDCEKAGMRVEEALAIRRMDVRRIEVGDRMVTQIAVHAARTDLDQRKATKTRQSVRIVGMVEPMGERLFEIARGHERQDLLCPISASRQSKAWRNYFLPPTVSKHAKKVGNYRGKLQELPYIPLGKMRNTHVTMMAEAGVSDSLNALYHGHTESVERRHYLSPDMTEATARVSDKLKLVL